ncbi:hypothetical protein WJX77_006178 [Trebouxia sp. C0004]
MQDAEHNWHLDIFSLVEATEHILSTMTFYLMKRGGAMTKFGMREASLCSYLQALEAGYNPVPYHNALTCCPIPVLRCAATTPGQPSGRTSLLSGHKAKVVDDLRLLASIMAATVHDYEHGGVNNDFLNRYSRLFSTLCCATLVFAALPICGAACL